MNEAAVSADFSAVRTTLTANRWIVSGVATLGQEVAAAIEAFRFNEAANLLYQFTWHSYCDWYIEFSKPILQGGDEAARVETRATLLWVLRRLLCLMHPIMPHLTEELWQSMGPKGGPMLIATPWPGFADGAVSADDVAEMEWVIRLISQIRAVRAEMNVPPAARIPLMYKDAGERTSGRLATHSDLIARLARVTGIEPGETVGEGAVQIVLDEATFILPLAEVIDIAEERARLEREIGRIGDDIDNLDKKLANKKFLEKAPADIVEEQRERKTEAEQARARLSEALERIAAG